MERTYTNKIKENIGKKVLIKGFAQEIRDLKNIKFILVRDPTGTVQAVSLKKSTEPESHELISKANQESSVQIIGEVQENKEAKQGYELKVEKFEIINNAEPLPIDISEKTNTGLDTRLDFRFLDFKRQKIQAIFTIQNEILKAFREYFYDQGFVEMQPPCIIAAASEGGTDLFSVKYFESDAYLAQSPQLYKQIVACAIEKVTMVTPVWRAEKHNTPRHLNEARQMDIEVAYCDQMQVMKYVEGVVAYIIKKVKEKCVNELKMLNIELKIPKGVYLSYDEAIEKVKGTKGEDFTPEQEKQLCAMYPGDVVFTHSWPANLKPFYIMTKDGKNSEGFDALYGGMEITSGGQRIHLPELLIERLKAKDCDPKHFKSYIDSFRYGAPPHSGWSIGLERITMIICGLDNIREATMFPRDRDRLIP